MSAPDATTYPVGNVGAVTLLRAMGDDLAIVNAARQSYDRTSALNDDGSLSERDTGLIRAMMRERHGVPFEHVVVAFHVRCAIFVAREWMRHRIGSFSELSMRYVEAKPEVYLPTYIRRQTGKAMAYAYEPLIQDADYVESTMCASVRDAFEVYGELLEAGVAKEVARAVLPVAAATSFTWTVNLRSLMNFLELRTHETALFEIRVLAHEVERLVTPIAPVAMAAWNEHGRRAP